MWLIAGLGNPGNKYANNRHNIGFMAIDVLADRYRASERSEHKALTYNISLNGPEGKSEKVILCKPQTFMNLSGESIQALSAFYKVSPQNLIVLHDEIDQPFGHIKLATKRGHGGQNGIRDIHEKLGNEYYRVRLGVSRPPDPRFDIADWVLSNFAKEEIQKLPEFLKTAADAVEYFVFNGYEKAATKFNGDVFKVPVVKPPKPVTKPEDKP